MSQPILDLHHEFRLQRVLLCNLRWRIFLALVAMRRQFTTRFCSLLLGFRVYRVSARFRVWGLGRLWILGWPLHCQALQRAAQAHEAPGSIGVPKRQSPRQCPLAGHHLGRPQQEADLDNLGLGALWKIGNVIHGPLPLGGV